MSFVPVKKDGKQALYRILVTFVSGDHRSVPDTIRTSLNLEKITQSFNILKENYNGVEVPSEEINPLHWDADLEDILEVTRTPDGTIYCLIRFYIEA